MRVKELRFHASLFLAVLPERIVEKRALGDARKAIDRLVIGGSRRDENVLAGATGESADVALDALRIKRKELADHVKAFARGGAVGGVRGQVTAQAPDASGQLLIRLLAIEHEHV